MEIRVEGELRPGVTAKDVILAVISRIGTDGATGTVVEYTGEAIRNISMEERMTVCNMSIEAGARAGMVAPDATTFTYLKNRPFAPKGKLFEQAVADWEQLATDEGAAYDRRFELDATQLAPQVTWGTSPGMGDRRDGQSSRPRRFPTKMNGKPPQEPWNTWAWNREPPSSISRSDRVFIGSCTNSRIEDLRDAAKVVRGQKVSPRVRAMVVPGSQQVKRQAEREGLDRSSGKPALNGGTPDAACVWE